MAALSSVSNSGLNYSYIVKNDPYQRTRPLDEIGQKFLNCIRIDDDSEATRLLDDLESQNKIKEYNLIIEGSISSEIFPYIFKIGSDFVEIFPSTFTHKSPQNQDHTLLNKHDIRIGEANFLHIAILEYAPRTVSVITKCLPELINTTCSHLRPTRVAGFRKKFSTLQLAALNRHPTALEIFRSILPHVNIQNFSYPKHYASKAPDISLIHLLAGRCDIPKLEIALEELSRSSNNTGRSLSFPRPDLELTRNDLRQPDKSFSILPDSLTQLICDYFSFSLTLEVINAVNKTIPIWTIPYPHREERHLLHHYRTTSPVDPGLRVIIKAYLETPYMEKIGYPAPFSSSRELEKHPNLNVCLTEYSLDDMNYNYMKGHSVLKKVTPAYQVATASTYPISERVKMSRLLQSAGADLGRVSIHIQNPLKTPPIIEPAKGIEDNSLLDELHKAGIKECGIFNRTSLPLSSKPFQVRTTISETITAVRDLINDYWWIT